MNQTLKDVLDKVNKKAFDTVDPSMRRNYAGGMNSFDSSATSAQTSGTKAYTVDKTSPIVQFSVTITNAMAADLNIELFQYSSSQTKMRQTDVNGYYPVNAMQTNLTFATGTANTYLYGSICGNLTQFVNAINTDPNIATTSLVGFDSDGNLIYQPGRAEDGSAVAGTVKVQCQQVPYRQLFENSGVYPFRVVKIRMNFNSENQIQQEIVEREKTFLGSKYEDKVSPDTYFTPNQFQSLKVDVPTPFVITNERGLNYTMLGTDNAGLAGGVSNIVKMNMFLQIFTKGGI